MNKKKKKKSKKGKRSKTEEWVNDPQIWRRENIQMVFAGVCYAAVGVFLFFSVWFGDGSKPWSTVGDGDAGVRTWFTLVTIMCVALSVLAVRIKILRMFQDDVVRSFVFGIFVTSIAFVIIVLSASTEFRMGF